jgi:hypothetical protein
MSSVAWAAKERVMTMARSSASGTASVASARLAMGLCGRQVTARVNSPRARASRMTSRASVVEPERETTSTGCRAASPGANTDSGRSSTSDSGAATVGRPQRARRATAATWAM